MSTTSSLATVLFLLFSSPFPLSRAQLFSVGRGAQSAACALLRPRFSPSLLVLFDLSRELLEGHIYVRSVLRRGFKELHIILTSQVLSLFRGYLAHVHEVRLVADKNFLHVRFRMLLDLLYPRAHVVKRVLPRHVVHQHDAHRAFVVSLGDGSEALLPSGVPNLHLDLLTIDRYGLNFEIDAWSVSIALTYRADM